MRFRIPSGPVLAAALAVVSGCAPQPPRVPAPVAPQPVAPVPPPVPTPTDWRDVPQTPETWTYRQDGRGSIALFGPAGADALLTLRCDAAARTIYLSRAGTALAPLTVRTSSVARALRVQPTGGTPPYVAVALAANDPLLDAMGFSRGRFAIEQSGTATLAVLAWAEVERVTQDCRG